MILVDSDVNKEHIQTIISKFPSIVLYNVSELEAEDPMDLTTCCSSIGPTHPHMIIFTSGTTGNPKVPSTLYSDMIHPRIEPSNLCFISGRFIFISCLRHKPSHIRATFESGRCFNSDHLYHSEPNAPHQLHSHYGLGTSPPACPLTPMPALFYHALADDGVRLLVRSPG
jgi:hypothetical protein